MRTNEVFTLEEMEKAKAYWVSILSGEMVEVKVHADFAWGIEYKRDQLEFHLPEDLSLKIFSLSKDQDLLLYIVLMSALKAFIFKYMGMEDIVIGSPIYTTTGETYEFNKVIFIRDHLNPQLPFKELLKSIKQSVIDGYKNQHYSMEKILEMLGYNLIEVSFSQILLVLENIHQQDIIKGIVNSYNNDITL